MNQMDSSFVGNNGVKIYAKKNIVTNPKANVVIVHGICEHLDRYDYLCQKLNEQGYNVYRYDARGHGRSEGNRGDLNEYQDFLIDLDTYINNVKNEYPDLKLILLGHSMGGLVATSYAATFNEKIDYLALSGAANVTPKQARPLKILPMFLIKKIKYKNNLGEGVCSDKEVVEKYNNDPLVLKEATMGLMKNVFIGGCGLVKDNISRIKVPTLVMHGKGDGIVDYTTAEWTFNNLSVEDKELKIYDGLYHEIFNEVKKDVVIEDLINWLNKRVEG
jgi:alpha-beta hydrolase superfamily lysophospholipase